MSAHDKERHRMKCIVAALVLMLGAPAFAGIEANGGFETFVTTASGGSIPTGSFNFTSLNAGDTSITGWTIGAAGIDLINTLWTSHGGSYSIDLSNVNNGTISQTLTTVANQNYELRFWMAGNTGSAPTVKTMNVTFGSTTINNVSFNSSGFSNSNMGWTEYVYKFTATGTSTLLQFADTSGSASGVALDDIGVSAVPEPGTAALFVLGAGVGALGLLRRRNSRKPTTAPDSRSRA
jgi:choice-of-anchor C domain-containing protein